MILITPEMPAGLAETIHHDFQLADGFLDLAATLDNVYLPWSAYDELSRNRASFEESSSVARVALTKIVERGNSVITDYAVSVWSAATTFDKESSSDRGPEDPATHAIRATFAVERLDDLAAGVINGTAPFVKERNTEQARSEVARLVNYGGLPRIAALTERSLDVVQAAIDNERRGGGVGMRAPLQPMPTRTLSGYAHVNSKGITYYLNTKVVTLRGGESQRIYYFSKDERPEGASLPPGFSVGENPRNGFLTVKRDK